MSKFQYKIKTTHYWINTHKHTMFAKCVNITYCWKYNHKTDLYTSKYDIESILLKAFYCISL